MAVLALVTGGLIVSSPRSVHADATFLVNTAADDGLPDDSTFHPERCTTNPTCTLRDAVIAADYTTGPSTISFDPSVNGKPIVLSQATRLLVRSAQGTVSLVSIVGNGPTKTIVDGGGATEVFTLLVSTHMSGLTVRNGKGGLGTVDCPALQSGHGCNAGGVYSEFGPNELTNVVITGNSTIADFGQGAGIDNSGAGTILTLTNSTVSGNSTSSVGRGAFGGGVHVDAGSTVTVVNSTISGNHAGAGGGGAFVFGTLTALNSSIVGNTSANGAWGLGRYSGSVTVTNTVVANDPTLNCTGTITSNGHNIDTGNSCGFTSTGDQQNVADPKLGALQDNGGPTPTQALLPHSPAIDAGDNAACAASPVSSRDQRGLPRFPGADTVCDIGAFEVQPTATPGDFDGDHKSDLTVYRPSTGTWYTKNSGGSPYSQVPWGQPTDVTVPADYDGTASSQVAVYRPSTAQWFVRHANGTYSVTTWGAPGGGDIPVPADYEGVGRADIAIFRPSTGEWFVLKQDGSYTVTAWGAPGGSDIPVPAAYDGGSRSQIAIFRPSTGQWYVLHTGGGYTLTTWGAAGGADIPVPGDYEGSGAADIAIYRRATGEWFVLRQNGSYTATVWGASGSNDIPQVGDFNGDGKADLTVYRPGSTGIWYVLPSDGSSYTATGWGTTGDVPTVLPAAVGHAFFPALYP